MAVPKRKISRTNRDKRRTHDGIKLLNITECSRCHSKKIAHHVCIACGYYKNTEIIPQKKDKKAKAKVKEEVKTKEKAEVKEEAAKPSSPEKKPEKEENKE
ncbi:MAG TPA: 50S ribosomal protein L32 [Actinobacteria bacterium]|nr:50S ribosomal protein L32 [Actinomycetota bacterium]